MYEPLVVTLKPLSLSQYAANIFLSSSNVLVSLAKTRCLFCEKKNWNFKYDWYKLKFFKIMSSLKHFPVSYMGYSGSCMGWILPPTCDSLICMLCVFFMSCLSPDHKLNYLEPRNITITWNRYDSSHCTSPDENNSPPLPPTPQILYTRGSNEGWLEVPF